MKILYAIQGTGNGHLSRARDIIPMLRKKGALDIMISGTQADLSLPFPVKYRLKGLSFTFGKKGGVDLWDTFAKQNLGRFIKEVRDLPVAQYDLIINDFEPVSAWAARLTNTPCISLSHQYAVLTDDVPLPEKQDTLGRCILQHYAPAKTGYGFHFKRFNAQTFTPVIRKEVRQLDVADKGHYTVYLPSYSVEKLNKTLSKFTDISWQVFSKHPTNLKVARNILLKPLDNRGFIESMAASSGVLCGAGFETPAEALYLKKKLLVVPMKNQYEQHCNAAALKSLGVPVLKNLKTKHSLKIEDWLSTNKVVEVDYPDITEAIIDMIFQNHPLPQQKLLHHPDGVRPLL